MYSFKALGQACPVERRRNADTKIACLLVEIGNEDLLEAKQQF
jgi:hypothetical protein